MPYLQAYKILEATSRTLQLDLMESYKLTFRVHGRGWFLWAFLQEKCNLYGRKYSTYVPTRYYMFQDFQH